MGRRHLHDHKLVSPRITITSARDHLDCFVACPRNARILVRHECPHEHPVDVVHLWRASAELVRRCIHQPARAPRVAVVRGHALLDLEDGPAVFSRLEYGGVTRGTVWHDDDHAVARVGLVSANGNDQDRPPSVELDMMMSWSVALFSRE